MDSNFPRNWMWSEALQMLARAEQLHREAFRPGRAVSSRPAWEPPVDILETERAVLVIVALPGVNPGAVEVSLDGDELVVSGQRALPPEIRTAVIHRLELPQGLFERRVKLPPGRYSGVTRAAADGCVIVALQKSGVSVG
jgi:HSP20 family molecular chaperone IbpA